MKKTGKPFNSKTGKAAKEKSPWFRGPHCGTENARKMRAKFDAEDK